MKSRFAVLGSLGVAALLTFGFAMTQGYGFTDAADRQEKKPRPGRQSRAERRALQPPGPGKYLAFDVRPKDYKITTRYVLEIASSSGELKTHDLQKPALQRRSIMIPLPDLAPGKYTLVVIAESAKGATRSQPLNVEIPGK